MSATIYQFPPRGRYAPGRSEAKDEAATRPAVTACGSAWYHDEAIKEASDKPLRPH